MEAESTAARSSSTSDVGRRLAAAIEERNIDAFSALFTEDAVGYHPLSPEPLRGRTAIRASEAELFAAFSDVRVDVRSDLSDDRTCALEVVLSATNTGPLDLGGNEPMPATGRRIEIPATWWYDVGDEGLIVEARDYFDTNALLAQLGGGDEEHAG